MSQIKIKIKIDPQASHLPMAPAKDGIFGQKGGDVRLKDKRRQVALIKDPRFRLTG